MSFWPEDTAGKIADICGVLGLIVTCILTAGAVQVRKQLFVFPQHARKLAAHADAITAALNNYPQTQNSIEAEMGKIRGDLNSLKPFLPLGKKKTVDKAINTLGQYEQVRTEPNLRALQIIMYQLTTEMQNLSVGL